MKIHADGTLGLITHEGSTDGLNGVTLIDLSDPLQPSVISRTTTSLEAGVHNAWIEGDYAYLAVDGSSASSGLRVLDISDPANPRLRRASTVVRALSTTSIYATVSPSSLTGTRG